MDTSGFRWLRKNLRILTLLENLFVFFNKVVAEAKKIGKSDKIGEIGKIYAKLECNIELHENFAIGLWVRPTYRKKHIITFPTTPYNEGPF